MNPVKSFGLIPKLPKFALFDFVVLLLVVVGCVGVCGLVLLPPDVVPVPEFSFEVVLPVLPVSYTHLTLPTT